MSQKTQNTKKVEYMYAKSTSVFWGTTAKRKAEVVKKYFRNGEHHLMGKWADNDEKFDLPLTMFSQAPGAEIMEYKGYKIITTPNGTHFTSLIFKGKEALGGTFSGPNDKHNSVYKAIDKIDTLIKK